MNGGAPFYVVKIDIAKAFDSIAQEKLGELVVRKIAKKGMPWEARLWLSLLEARELHFHVQHSQVSISQTIGVAAGQPRQPRTLCPLKPGKHLTRPCRLSTGGQPPHVGRHDALQPPPHSGAAFMDDTYIWGESPEYVQRVLDELEKQLRKLGLSINPKKTQVISNMENDPVRFTIGGVQVTPDGPQDLNDHPRSANLPLR